MEVGKRLEEEAGPSSAGKMDELRLDKSPETASEVGEEVVDDKEGFAPGPPLLSLKEQIEKDKFVDDDKRCYMELQYSCEIKNG